MLSDVSSSRPLSVVCNFVYCCALMGIFVLGCGDSSTGPTSKTSISRTGVIHGSLSNNDITFQFISAINGDPENPIEGPFAIRGKNISYDTISQALVVDLSIVNLGDNSYPEPVTVTFLSFVPEDVTLLNPDNDEHGSGASITFSFTNDDGLWTPNEESTVRSTFFSVGQGISFSFVVRVDVGSGQDGLGSLGGVVWIDRNGDGFMDDDEPSLGGATIEISSTNLKPVTAQSAEDGSYRFDRLEAGLYTVRKLPQTGIAPTTPAELTVQLIDLNGTVTSFLAANFGCQEVTDTDFPIQVGNCVHVNGRYASDPHRVISHSIGIGRRGGNHDNDDDGFGNRAGLCFPIEIRGPVTDRDVGGNIIEIMGTRVKVIDRSNVDDFEIGRRARVRLFSSLTSGSSEQRMGYRLRKWNGNPDKIHGIVEQARRGANGRIEIIVAGTLIEVSGNANIGN